MERHIEIIECPRLFEVISEYENVLPTMFIYELAISDTIRSLISDMSFYHSPQHYYLHSPEDLMKRYDYSDIISEFMEKIERILEDTIGTQFEIYLDSCLLYRTKSIVVTTGIANEYGRNRTNNSISSFH